MAEALLEVEDLRVHFAIGGGLFRRGGTVRAVDGVSLQVRPGEVVGLVGESGSGKTTLGRAVLRLVEPTAGTVRFDGQAVTGLGAADLKALRSRMQIIFQDPYASLNPRMSVGQILGEALMLHGIGTRAERAERIGDLLQQVGLQRDAAGRFPHEFSGGQRQRIGIARALAVQPSFVVADEPVSALDVSIQAQIINLLQDLRERLGLSLLFIGHDLSVIEFLCDRVVVLYLGKVMESAPVAELYQRPRHPYTQALLDAAPRPDPRAPRRGTPLRGELPSPLAPPSGCVFRTRCPHAAPACAETVPPIETVGTDHQVACLRWARLDLRE